MSDRRRQTAGAAVGATAGQGVYQLAGYAPSHHARRSVGWDKRASDFPEGSPERAAWKAQDKAKKAHRKAHTTPAGTVDWTQYWRTYPTELRRSKTFRTIGRTHSGRSGVALGTAATLVGAGIGARKVSKRTMVRHLINMKDNPKEVLRVLADHPQLNAFAVTGAGGAGYLLATRKPKQKKVAKADLQLHERRVSPLRATEAAVGIGLLGWGGSRVGVVGPTLRRGASVSRNVRAKQAFERAERARAATERATGRGAAMITGYARNKGYRGRGLRPIEGAVGGALLLNNAYPIRRDHYSPYVPTQGW